MTTPHSAIPPIGLTHRETMIVTARHTVPHVEPDRPGFIDMPPVFATAMMIGFIEQTCITALRPYLPGHQQTVGTHVDIGHSAATPEGATVTATVTLVEIAGRSLRFAVSCHDGSGPIGEGTHRRDVIDSEAFIARVTTRK